MYYNYCHEPLSEDIDEAKEMLVNEMGDCDIIWGLVDEFGYMKYLNWCLRQPNFLNEFSSDIETTKTRYFEDNCIEEEVKENV